MLRILCPLLLAGASLFAASAQAVTGRDDTPEAGLDYGLHVVSYPAHAHEFTGLALEDHHLPVTIHSKSPTSAP